MPSHHTRRWRPAAGCYPEAADGAEEERRHCGPEPGRHSSGETLTLWRRAGVRGFSDPRRAQPYLLFQRGVFSSWPLLRSIRPSRHPQQPLPALLASVPAEAPHPLAVFTGRSSTWGWGWWPWARSPQAWVLFATKVEHEGFTNHDTFQPAKQRPVLMAARPPHHSLRCMGTGRPAVPQVIWQCRQGTLLCPSFFRSLGPCILPTPTRAHQLPSCALCIVTAP